MSRSVIARNGIVVSVTPTEIPVAPIETVEPPIYSVAPIAVMAWGPVGVVLFTFSWRYGYYGDELYFLAAGHLPPADSPDRGYFYFGQPPADTTTVLFVGVASAYLHHYFHHVQLLATTDTRFGPNNSTSQLPLWLCRQPTTNWRQLWTTMRTPVPWKGKR